MTRLPPELARCTALEFLHAGGNKLGEFGQELCEALVNLRELYICRNKIDLLPSEVRVIMV